MREVREYQIAIQNNIPKYLKEFGSTIVQSPTGSGKSHIINESVKRIEKAGKVPLVLSDNLKIHSQLVKECSGIRLDSGSKYALILQGHCYVGMSQSLRNRAMILEQFKELKDKLVVIVDECHRNTMTPLVEHLQPDWLVGFSATPHFKWAKHLPNLYKSLIAGPQIGELVGKYLAHYRHVIRTGADLDQLEVRKGNNDFSEESQEKVFGSKKMYDGIFDDLPEFKGKKTVIYVASIRLCEQMYEKLQERGYKVCRYHSKLDNGVYELSKFTELNQADICVSVGALTLGWDYPPIDTIILWRATTSLPLYLQMCGRGSRIIRGVKEQFTVLDYGGNLERFGPWDMDRDWTELWQDPKKKKKISMYTGVAASKECPVCHSLLATTARSCFNCGYIYPEAEMRLVEGQLLEVRNTLNEMKGKKVGDLSAEDLANYAKYNDKKAFAVRIAKANEQKSPGYLKAFANAMGYKSGWLVRQLEDLDGAEPIEHANFRIR